MCARSAPEKKTHYFKFEIVLAVFSDNFKYEIIFHNILFQIGARSAPEKKWTLFHSRNKQKNSLLLRGG